MTLFGLNGRKYELNQKPFSSGGEGDVYSISGVSDRVVKIYKTSRVTKELEEKIKLMVKRPPSSSVLNQVAWPIDAVYDSTDSFCGFVMPKLDITDELSDIYVYPPKMGITYQQKLVLAQNICVVIHEVHRAGYVFGDFNPRNIGINANTGAVAFLDTDSYHIVLNKDGNQAYRCSVCAPGYAAPELLEKCAYHIAAHPEDKQVAYGKTPLDTFTRETDNFALAIHMFRLLMNGFTPFNGINENESASVGSPGVGDAAVKRDSYCFKPGNKPQATAVPDMTILPDEVANLFTRAFIEGRKNPTKRPNAIEWHKALEDYERNLVVCSKSRAHMYKRGLSACPWCEADDRYMLAMSPQLKQKSFGTPVMPVVVPQVNSSQSASSQGYTSTQPKPKVFKKLILGLVVAIAITSTAYMTYNNVIIPGNKYKEAQLLYENTNFEEARNIFLSLGDYKDSIEQAKEMSYLLALNAMDEGDYQSAYIKLSDIRGYKDSEELYYESRYAYATKLLKKGDYEEAIEEFASCGDYSDSESKVDEGYYLLGIELSNTGDFIEAIQNFENSKGYADSAEIIDTIKESHPLLLAEIEDEVVFGSYEQNNDGGDKEPVEWRVLERNGTVLLLISKYCLDCRPNYTTGGSYTWKDSQLYSWLNDVFYLEAFSDDEKDAIVTVGSLGIEAFEDVANDKVTLLNRNEALLFFYSDADRKAGATNYAIAQGLSVREDGTCFWYLRLPDAKASSSMHCVVPEGWCSYYSAQYNNDEGVRPVICVDTTK